MQPIAILCVDPHFHTMTCSELWQRIREARRYADLTQDEVARHCGVSRAAVAQWEAGQEANRSRPETRHLMAFSEVTRVPIEWLLNDRSDLKDVYRAAQEGAGAFLSERGPPPDVLPDLEQEGHLFTFASVDSAEQIKAKLERLQQHPAPERAHLVLLGAKVDVRVTADAKDALATVFRVLKQESDQS